MTTSNAPTGDDQGIWEALLAAHSVVTDRLDQDLIDNAEMGLAEFEVLDHLTRAEDLTIRMNELAALVRLSPSGLTRRFDTLVRRGLVLREPCDDDRRGINARLTPEGLRRHARAVGIHEAGVRDHVLAKLDEHEKACLAAALRSLASDGPDRGAPTGAPGASAPNAAAPNTAAPSTTAAS